MPRGIALAAAVLSVALAAGCGSGEDRPRSGADAASAEVEATLNPLLDGSDPAAICGLLSSRQLTESFGKRDPLTRCRENAEVRGEGNPITTYQVVHAKQRCARVDVEEQRGGEVVFFMQETNGRWPINNIETPPVSGSINLCGSVRLFSGEGSG